jgi:hypothetical protein
VAWRCHAIITAVAGSLVGDMAVMERDADVKSNVIVITLLAISSSVALLREHHTTIATVQGEGRAVLLVVPMPQRYERRLRLLQVHPPTGRGGNIALWGNIIEANLVL